MSAPDLHRRQPAHPPAHGARARCWWCWSLAASGWLGARASSWWPGSPTCSTGSSRGSGRQQTTLGAMLDPVADKVLLSSAFVALTWGPGLAVRHPRLAHGRHPVARRDHRGERGHREPDPRPAGLLPLAARQAVHGEPAPDRGRRAAGRTCSAAGGARLRYLFVVDPRPHRGQRAALRLPGVRRAGPGRPPERARA